MRPAGGKFSVTQQTKHMSKKKSATETSATTTDTAPKTRTPKALTATQQSLIAGPAASLAAAKNQIKEAKSLGKVIEHVNKLSAWGLGELEKSIADHRAELAAAAPVTDGEFNG